MKQFVSTLIGGALGLVALYVVGKVAYQAGYDICDLEHRREALEKETPTEEEDSKPEPEVPKKNKLGVLKGLKLTGSKKTSVISRLIKHPEDHQIEAFVDGEDVRVRIKPRGVLK